MPQPTFLSDGTTPRRTDPRWFRWAKILGAFQNRAGADPANDPRRDDTFRDLQQKVIRATNSAACQNIIPSDAQYDNEHYQIDGLIEGNRYQVIFGANDMQLHAGDSETVFNPGDTTPIVFTAGEDGFNEFIGFGTGPVTAKICAL